MYFLHVAVITVAINSADQALLTLLVLNNFSEIKSFVFKKMDRKQLFVLVCTDITEGFKISLFFFCIVAVSLSQASNSMWYETLSSHGLIFITMQVVEALTDSIKHAFISNLTNMSADIYDEFGLDLRRDILACHKNKMSLDHTSPITSRVGLAQLPLGCVAIRYFIIAFMSPQWQVSTINPKSFFTWRKRLIWGLVFCIFVELSPEAGHEIHCRWKLGYLCHTASCQG